MLIAFHPYQVFCCFSYNCCPHSDIIAHDALRFQWKISQLGEVQLSHQTGMTELALLNSSETISLAATLLNWFKTSLCQSNAFVHNTSYCFKMTYFRIHLNKRYHTLIKFCQGVLLLKNWVFRTGIAYSKKYKFVWTTNIYLPSAEITDSLTSIYTWGTHWFWLCHVTMFTRRASNDVRKPIWYNIGEGGGCLFYLFFCLATLIRNSTCTRSGYRPLNLPSTQMSQKVSSLNFVFLNVSLPNYRL